MPAGFAQYKGDQGEVGPAGADGAQGPAGFVVRTRVYSPLFPDVNL